MSEEQFEQLNKAVNAFLKANVDLLFILRNLEIKSILERLQKKERSRKRYYRMMKRKCK